MENFDKVVGISKKIFKNNKIIILLIICVIIIVMFSLRTNFVTEQQIDFDNYSFEYKTENSLGGWQEEKDGKITDGLKDIFEEATNSDEENTYEPIRLLASQVVAGFNYKFLANVTNNETGEKKQYYVYIFTDLDGVSSLKGLFLANN